MTQKNKLELYIHIPFCENKCKYCDFLSDKADDRTQRYYVEQLVEEIRAQGVHYTDYHVNTVFIGGGTPSILKGIWMANIMSAVYESFIVEATAEITIECNPGTLTKDKLDYYKQSGINRISLGLQSTVDEELKTLGRIHTYDTFLKSYQMVRQAGFTNVNIDLMNSIPGQSIDSFKSSLKKVIMLKPEHISAYSLIIEEGTPFFELYGKGEHIDGICDEEEDRKMYKLAGKILEENGYKRYEISNYAKKGYECKHNTGYWTGREYLGLGLGASSYVMGRRFNVEKDLGKYMYIDMHKDITPLYQNIHELSEIEKMEEFMFLGLRMIEGVSSREFMDRFGLNMFNVFENAIKRNMVLRLLDYKSPYLFLTERGLDLSNMVMSDFLISDDK